MAEKDDATMRKLLEEDNAAPWNDGVFARAELRDGDKILRLATGTLTKRGRPKSENPKRQVTLRLDGEVLDHFRSTGPGWQGRINEALKKTFAA